MSDLRNLIQSAIEECRPEKPEVLDHFMRLAARTTSEREARLVEALKDAKKTVEKRFLECGRQGANAHMTNPLRTEWEHCRATLHEIGAALAAYSETAPKDGKP